MDAVLQLKLAHSQDEIVARGARISQHSTKRLAEARNRLRHAGIVSSSRHLSLQCVGPPLGGTRCSRLRLQTIVQHGTLLIRAVSSFLSRNEL
jgi:hypothetical protein